ncbi:MAG: sigma-54 dependent transcriptional regulator [Alistipes senegalensis]|nr:sigma-54 dependent transcriptional regulator [Bacteroides cellulosilyticus]MCM1352342.1 sigma-54 dependent transcriptional regulator [Alistipes senegalensis]
MTQITPEQITSVKQRFGIIGTSELLDRALEVALRVAPTDLTVLVTGESGVGKEFFPQVIHANSARKHNKYIAVNCAAIPEGTIDSELFGHEKGAFTGALDARKGYFEEADGGTIFLDEVAELPLPTQARLLRVLQSGEFIRVGSSKVQKTNVRVVAATNTDLPQAILSGRFREDLYYRLGTVPIVVPALRERPGDIPLLFRKFASDVATQYRMPAITLDNGARELLMDYYWRGNIRQLKNVAEQISAIEQVRVVTPEVLAKYLPRQEGGAPMTADIPRMNDDMATERELLYKVLFDMRSDINDLKRMLSELTQGTWMHREPPHDIKALLPSAAQSSVRVMDSGVAYGSGVAVDTESEDVTDEPPREKTKADMQREQIVRALRRNNGRRREAAAELFMSERTLYRKIKELGIEENS